VTDVTTRPDGDQVEIRVPADSAYVATLRLAAASLGARCDLTVDDIEDVRLAVDEASALLLPYAAPGGVLTGSFVLAAGELSVGVGIAADRHIELDRGGFAWLVLAALATAVEVERRDGRLIVTVTKRRQAAQQ
jgi:serine/threonine-protein kinase RsbW